MLQCTPYSYFHKGCFIIVHLIFLSNYKAFKSFFSFVHHLMKNKFVIKCLIYKVQIGNC